MEPFILKLKQIFRPVCNNKEIQKDETETELSECNTIIEEKERCIKEILSAKLYMEDVVDKIVARLKAIYEYQDGLLFKTHNSIFLYVMNGRRRNYFLTNPERNIQDILEAFDECNIFKWREECRNEKPIDYNFILCKDTLSNFEGSKGCVGELSVVDTDSEDYDVINFKAEPMLNSRPYDDGTDEVYLHARWFKLAQLKYEFLVRLTLASVETLGLILGFELGMEDRENEYCVSMLKYLCKINEKPPIPIPIRREEWATAWIDELTISEYRTAARVLGCKRFKSDLDFLSDYSFKIMKNTLNRALFFDLEYFYIVEDWGKLYNIYNLVVKRGRGQKEGVFTFGPLILRYSKTKNRTE